MNTTAEERQLLRTLAEEGLAENNGSDAMAETWNLIIDTVDDLEQAIKHIHRLLAPAPVEPHGQEDENNQTPEPNPNQGSDPS